MKALAVLILCSLIVLNVKADYSIESFINYMQEKGYYDLLGIIKYYYGYDIAIDFCLSLVETNDCEVLIRIYIPSRSRGDSGGGQKPTLDSILQDPDFYEINHVEHKPDEIHFMIEEIKKKYNIN